MEWLICLHCTAVDCEHSKREKMLSPNEWMSASQVFLSSNTQCYRLISLLLTLILSTPQLVFIRQLALFNDASWFRQMGNNILIKPKTTLCILMTKYHIDLLVTIYLDQRFLQYTWIFILYLLCETVLKVNMIL